MSDLDLILDIIFMAIFLPLGLWFWLWFVPTFTAELPEHFSKFISSKRIQKIFGDMKAIMKLLIIFGIPISLVLYFYTNDPIVTVLLTVFIMPAGYWFFLDFLPRRMAKIGTRRKESETSQERYARKIKQEDRQIILMWIFLIGVPLLIVMAMLG